MALLVLEPAWKFVFPSDRPSPLYPIFSGLINGIGVIWDIVNVNALSDASRNCGSSDVKTWLLLAIVTHLINIAFGVYAYFRFCQGLKAENNPSGSQVLWRLLFYDWGVCLYILVLIWHLAWIIYSGNMSTGPTKCADLLQPSIVLLVLYLIGSAIVVAFTVFLQTCREFNTWPAQPQRPAQPANGARSGATPAVGAPPHRGATVEMNRFDAATRPPPTYAPAGDSRRVPPPLYATTGPASNTPAYITPTPSTPGEVVVGIPLDIPVTARPPPQNPNFIA